MDSKDDAAASEGSRPRRFNQLQAPAEWLLVASEVALSCYGVWEEPRRLQLLAFIAVAYVAVVALTLFARRLDARGRRVPLDARERWMKLAARLLASFALNVLMLRTDSLMPLMLLISFIW